MLADLAPIYGAIWKVLDGPNMLLISHWHCIYAVCTTVCDKLVTQLLKGRSL
jgi:hypothetical protein